jgi:hypothetical protein
VFYGESLIQASFSLSFFISRFAFTFLFVIFCCCCFVASSFYALYVQTQGTAAAIGDVARDCSISFSPVTMDGGEQMKRERNNRER